MLGGALALRKEAALDEKIIGFFMLFTFLTTVVTEVLLVRQLSRLTEQPKQVFIATPQNLQGELPPAPARSLVEPMPSVTESTTRTLEYSRKNR
jgi:hypothetical protein